MLGENDAQPAQDAAPLAARNGGPAFLALWLLITTNQSFLLDPAQVAVAADQAAGTPIGTTKPDPEFPQDDTIATWEGLTGALIAKLNGGGNDDDLNFTKENIQNLLTSTLFGNNLDNEDGTQGDTYASALYKAATVFQRIQIQFVNKWGDVCPPTVGNALGVSN